MPHGKNRKGPHPHVADINAAAHLSSIRAWRGLSQSALGEGIGVTFQQIQKYEKAKDRMAVSTIYDISRILEVPVVTFFHGLEGVDTPQSYTDLLLEKDEIQILRTYRRAPDSRREMALRILRMKEG